MLKIILKLGLLLLIPVLHQTLMAQQEETKVWTSVNKSFQVSYDSQLQPIVINQIHSWTLHVSNADGDAINDAVITVKGGMPEHNHGLATQPSIEAVGGGDYLLQGLRFHMMGYWELELAITQGSIMDMVIVKLDL